MIGGATWTWWIGFHLAVALLLLVDSCLPSHRHESRQTHWAAWLWTACLAIAAALFAGWIALRQGHVPALQFVAGYAIETSLSIDNLFVFLILFRGFRISHHEQHRALLWGVFGAIILRAVFIALGVSLLNRFGWVSYIFGAILLYAAWRLVRGSSASDALPGWVVQLQKHRRGLLVVILAVEATDLLFAVDSIPAVLAVSRDPFVVYTSNIAAILGLRSLYFALSSLLDRFRYLHYGLGALLAFVAAKMLLAHWIEIPTGWSLSIMAAILVVCALASWLVKGKTATLSPKH
jgi:tellurite resistance protein TerC